MKKTITLIIILLLIGLVIVGIGVLYKKIRADRYNQEKQIEEIPSGKEPESKLPRIVSGDLYGNIEVILPFAKKDLNKNYVFIHDFKKGETVDRNRIEKLPSVSLSVGGAGGTFWQDRAAEIPVTVQDFKAYVAVNCTSENFCLVSILGVKPGLRLDFEGVMLEAK